jgi:hypothetical protein
LTKVVERFIAADDVEMLWRRVTELESENSKPTDATAMATKDYNVL